jgi:hypothetical protein
VAMSACTRATRNQIGRVRVVGECPVRLDLPGGQCGFQAHRWPLPTGCWLVGCVDPPRRHGTGGELLDRVESGNHAVGRLDLQHDRSLTEWLASPRTNFQSMLKVTLIPAQSHRGGVRGDIQHMQYLGVGGGRAGLAVGRYSCGCHGLLLKQAPGLYEVRCDLLPCLIPRPPPGPVSSGDAAPDRPAHRCQDADRITIGRDRRVRRKDGPQLGCGLHQRRPSAHQALTRVDHRRSWRCPDRARVAVDLDAQRLPQDHLRLSRTQ